MVDDASHQLEPTRTSFEVLFPRLRPGGLYCIEDWSCQHGIAEAVKKALLAGGARSEALREDLLRTAMALLGEPRSEDALLRASVAPNEEHHRRVCNALADALQTNQPLQPKSRKPLSRLAVDLLLVRARPNAIVDELRIEHWIVVVKGEGDIDPETFRIADHTAAPAGLMD